MSWLKQYNLLILSTRSLSKHVSTILCEKMGSIHKTFLPYIEVWRQSWGWIVGWTTGFFLQQIPFFSWKSHYTRLRLFRFEYLMGISLKMLIQENRLLYFLLGINLEILGKNLRVWKLVFTFVSLKTFQFLKIFLLSSIVILTNVTFWYYIVKCVTI